MPASSQTRGPSALLETAGPVTQQRYQALYAERPAFVIGWNWGAAPLQVNVDLRTNAVHADYPFAYASPRYRPPWVSAEAYPPGTSLIMAPQWFVPEPMVDSLLPWYRELQAKDPKALRIDLGKGNRPSLGEAIGMRFQPELSVTDTTSLQPPIGDRQGTVWGFGYLNRERVRVVASPTDPNHGRVVVAGTPAPNEWTRVLGASWPQDRLCEWGNMNHLQQMSPFNGKRMYLSVNLRRTNAQDTLTDDDPVLRLRVYYTTCDTTRAEDLVVFDSIPSVAEPLTRLPKTLTSEWRGSVRPLTAAPTALTELIITRAMLPRGDASDADRDATIMAHFTCDGQSNPRFRDRWSIGKAFKEIEKREGRIDRMWVEVDHSGTTEVAIDFVQLGTENMTWLTQGWYDEVFAAGYADMAANLAAYNRMRFGADTSLHLRIWRWYMRDEAPEAWWQGIRYMNQLFDGRGLTENELDVDHDRFVHLTDMDHSWEGLTLKITPDVLAPYYDHGHGGDPKKVPDYMGYRFGISDVAWQTKESFDYDTHSSVGLQSLYEKLRRELHANQRYLFLADHKWIANLWLCGDWMVHDDGRNVRGTSYTPRQLTGEEASLLAWSQIILGAKGLVYWWGANADSLTQKEHYTSRGYVAPGIAHGPVRPTVVVYTTDSTGRTVAGTVERQPSGVAEARTTWLHQQPARSASSGPDWLRFNDPTGLYQAIELSSAVTLSEALPKLYATDPPGEFYTGWMSVRSALQSVGDICDRAADTLSTLQLRAWHVRGSESWTVGNAEIERVLDVQQIRTRHPMRPAQWDAPQDTYIEVSVLAMQDGDPDSAIVIGVLNRRCNPHDIAYESISSESFLTYEGHRRVYEDVGYRMAKYRQRGARMVVLPLNSDLFTDGKRYQITALGRDDISVVLDGPSQTMIPLLPGEGILLLLKQIN